MSAYIITYMIIFIFGILYEGNKKKTNAKKIYCVFITIVLLLLMGLRDETLGESDTVSFYIPRFNLIQGLTISKTFEIFRDTDPIFYVCTKIITFFTDNVNLYFFICSLPLVIGISRLIYKYSKIPMISYFVFLGLGYYFTAFITLRNSVALGILLFSYPYLRERKFWKFLFVVMLAYIFHNSAIFFLIAYPITKFEFKLNIKWIVVLVVFVLVVVFKDISMNIFFKFINNEHLLLYKDRNIQLNITLFLEYAFIFAISLFFKKYYYKSNFEEGNMLYVLTYIGTLITLLVMVQDVMYRVSAFYTIYFTILIPNYIACDENVRSRLLCSVTIMGILAIFGLKFANDFNLIPYQTFL